MPRGGDGRRVARGSRHPPRVPGFRFGAWGLGVALEASRDLLRGLMPVLEDLYGNWPRYHGQIAIVDYLHVLNYNKAGGRAVAVVTQRLGAVDAHPGFLCSS